jgi:hypothetical protein
MKRFKKGPELKMPDLKVPPALADLFYDLHDRRLLPLVALVVVAIVAVPFLLSDSGSSSLAPPASVEAASAHASTDRAARFTVTQVDPGLRVPRKRLAKRHAKDPFVQKFTQPPVSSEAPAAESATTSTTVTETSISSEPSPTPPALVVPVESPPPASSAPSGGGGAGAGTNVVTYTWAINVKITKTTTKPDGTKERSEPEVREGIIPPATLPAKKTQVVAYIGVNPTTEKPLFLVGTEVTSVFGEAKCVAGTTTCQLLEMEPTFPETFALGEGGANYKINVLSVERVPVQKTAASPE